MFSVSPQAARYTVKKIKKRFNFQKKKKTALNTYLNKIKLNCLVQYEFWNSSLRASQDNAKKDQF